MAEKGLVWENLDEWMDILKRRLPEGFHRASVTGITKSALMVVGWAKANSPVYRGFLRSSVRHEVKSPIGNVHAIIGSSMEYAAKMEKPGNVRRTGRRPWLEPAITEHIDRILKALMGEFRKLAKSLGLD